MYIEIVLAKQSFYKSWIEPFFKSPLRELSLTLFFISASYPPLRALMTSLFTHEFGTEQTIPAMALSAIVLLPVIYFLGLSQKRFGVTTTYLGVSFLSILLILGIYALHSLGFRSFTYIFFILKNIYMIVFLTIIRGRINVSFSTNFLKQYYGPMGALAGIGTFFGGGIMKYLDEKGIVALGVVFILMAAFTFYLSKKTSYAGKSKHLITSLKPISSYVIGIVLVVFLSQFFLFFVEYRWTKLIEMNFPIKIERTQYLGKCFKFIGLIETFLQLFITPLLFKFIKTEFIHFALFLLFTSLAFLTNTTSSLFLASCSYILYKSTDYSIFAVAKEFFYRPFTPDQKYGIKYFADLLGYRLGKVASSLLLLTLTSYLVALDVFILIGSLAWAYALYFLFFSKKKLSYDT